MAGPARTITPVPRRGSTNFSARSVSDLGSDRSRFDLERDQLVAKLFDGKTNNTGTVALATSPATTTDIDDPRISTTTIAFLQPLDSGASAEDAAGPPTQTVQAPGKIRLTHTSSGSTRTYGFVLLG